MLCFCDSTHISLNILVHEAVVNFLWNLVSSRKYINNLEGYLLVAFVYSNALHAVSGKDNRDLVDANTAQKLDQDDITAIKKSGASGAEIIAKLVQSSATFDQKTIFSQQKYLKKKQQKYITRFRLCQVQDAFNTANKTLTA